MSYRRDFTIGLRETRDFYLTLVLGRWKKGILGFAAVGALTAWLYTEEGIAGLPGWSRGLIALGGAGAVALLSAAALVIVTAVRVRSRLRRSGRDSYVQETEINGFGVHVTVGKDRARLSFDRILRVQETGRAFYIFLAENQAWILPKAQMEDRAAECRQLRELFGTVIERGRLRLRK